MAKKPQFTIYKNVKVNGAWRQCRAAYHPKNFQIIQNAVIVGGQQEVHEEGECYLRNKNQWIPAGSDARKAHTSLAITQKYLADVKPEETKKAVAASDFVPRPEVVRTGTDGD